LGAASPVADVFQTRLAIAAAPEFQIATLTLQIASARCGVVEIAGHQLCRPDVHQTPQCLPVDHAPLPFGRLYLAFAITFPLVFGWVHFETFAANAEMYRAVVFGFAVDQFSIHSTKAAVIFNLLNGAAVIVLVGLLMAAVRRITDAGERATQKFSEDILPLILIFAVTVTGLMLTVSYKFLAGRGYSLMAVVHMVSVIALLFYIPFGKLFHMFQRTCSLCVFLVQEGRGDE
jgi:nitrate reductase gamma subunit